MSRAALARLLAVAVLVTLPVTGPGRCPCRLARALGPPDQSPARVAHAPPVRKPCCSHHCHCPENDRPDCAPDRAHSGGPRPVPPDQPCRHGTGLEVTAVGPQSDRSAGGLRDTGAPVWFCPWPAAVERTAAHTPDEPRGLSVGHPVNRDLLRLANALRC